MASNTPSSATCGICSELYVDPRLLQCLHSFCSKCLKKTLEEEGSGTSLKCPACQKTASLPEGGVSALPRDLRKDREAVVAQYESKLQGKEEINCDRCIETANGPAMSFCVNCCDFLCKVCSKDHKTWRKTLNHELQPVGSSAKSDSKSAAETSLKNIPETPLNCQKHSDEALKFYCETCSMLICRDCIILEHSGHSYNRIEGVAEKEKADLVSILGKAKGAKTELDDAIAKGGKIMQQIQAKQKSVEDDIESAFESLFEALKKRKKALLAKAAEIGLGKQTALTLQGEEFKTLRNEMAETCEIITTATQIYTPAELLSAKKVMANKLQEFIKKHQMINLEPCRNDIMPSLLDTSALMEKITSFGVVLGGSCPGEAKTDLHILRAIVNKERKITITAYDIRGKPYPHGGEKVEAMFGLTGSTLTRIILDDKKNGTYIAKITPSTCGEHELSITIDSEPVKGSPFMLYVHQPRGYSNLSSDCQSEYETSDHPYDVAVDDNGDVYVANYNSHCIYVFNQQGDMIHTIGTEGSSGTENGEFENPAGIAVQGNVLYITDENNHRVQKISTSGQFISKFGSYGSRHGQLHAPRGICLDQDGRVFVSEYGNNRMSVFEADGTFVYCIHADGDLQNPWGLTFDPSGYLHVVDHDDSHCVVIFSPDGKYITQYDSQVTNPAGIAIDEEGYTFIAEYHNSSSYGSYSHISILNPDHTLINQIQNFNQASGITIDKEGYIYVCSANDNCVYKY